MLSHLRMVFEWFSLRLGLHSAKVHLSGAEEQKALAKALKLLNLIKSRKFAEALEDGSSTIKLLVSAATLEKAFDDLQKAQGPLVSFDPVDVTGYKSKTVARVLVKFEHGEFLAIVAIDPKGLIGGFRLKPAKDLPSLWKHPTYTDPDLFVEEDVKLHSNKIEVNATLSIPKNGKALAGVVFLAGSGPIDRDSTMGPNKPLKDLAWALASHQIAVCRWDKPTADDSDKISSEGMTLSKEYLPYALAAVEELRKNHRSAGTTREIPIFILGHSLGGTVAPLVAATDHSIKGLILLSAGAGKMYDSALRQVQHLASIDHGLKLATPEYAEALEKQVKVIHSPDFNEKTPADDLPFGAPASYWLDIKQYDQVAIAAKLDTPITILQAGRDYQVTIEDDFQKWKEGLGSGVNKDVTLKVYQSLNHLLINDESDGPLTPEGYSKEGHVDEALVMDVCAWIKKHSEVVH